jgi:hypothetical protein
LNPEGGGMGNKQGAIGTNSLGGFESSSSSSSSSSQRGNGTDSNKQKERGWDNPPQPIYRTGGREGGMAVLPYQRAERRPPPDLPQARRRGDEEEGGGGGGGSWAILWTGEATRNRGRDETRREDMRRDGGGGDDDGRWGGGGRAPRGGVINVVPLVVGGYSRGGTGRVVDGRRPSG